MGDKVVAVLAVHNEERMLPYTYQKLAGKVDSVVAVLDNCTDGSESIVDSSENVTCVRLGKHYWRNYRAETKHCGLYVAKLHHKDCYILMVDCDVLMDNGSLAQAKHILDYGDADAVVFAYKQYSLNGGFLERFKDEALNLFGKLTKKLTRQPVVTGVYLIRSEKACMGDVASDYETVLPKLKTAWVQTDFKHLRPRYDSHTQRLMGVCRATLNSYNLQKVLLYSLCTLSPHVAAGFLTAKLNGWKTVENGCYG